MKISDDDNYQSLLDLADQIFANSNLDIHYFDDDFVFVYDLNDNDDLHDLADQYNEG